jgi:HPt (histidine-containing phosphotransfer) domain-containing protein
MNWDRVHELRSEVGDDAFDEVVALFLEETDCMAGRLAARVDPATLGGDLHFMKGAALNLGFDELAAACAAAESALRSAGAGAVDLHALLEAYASSRRELLADTPRAMTG